MLVPPSPLPPHVDWDGLTSLSTALDALRDLMLSDVLLDVPIFVMGQPPLLFAASMYDEDMAMLILSQRHRIPVDVNVVDNHGFTALHYAADSDAVDLVRALLECPDVDVHATTEDLSVLGHVESGGRTPLHLASLRGNLAIVEALVLHDASVLSDVDWDGNSSLRLAQLHGRTSIQEFLQSQECSHLVVPPPSVESCLDHEKRTQQTVAAARYASSLAVPAALANVHVLRSILTIDECNYVTQALIAHTNRVGWQTKRHTAYPTTDLPSYCLPQVHLWVLATLRYVALHLSIPHTLKLAAVSCDSSGVRRHDL
ncbi:hypothetical protein, variant [Aphanomyces astaci]|uniref:Uncharacterized protein n=1 Tax=Aphanomyces astaci TaxID=112090 RepID=W4GRX2_APHAT|nr:hypothetical protein, variant [Aphanomyces astaci]ETV82485.1 hypothetical protein, variant [Aphanomyces astaci]|eukprot:XP_009828154.1 hypothetical protein, variant [Aphanomyces astaci]